MTLKIVIQFSCTIDFFLVIPSESMKSKFLTKYLFFTT